MRDLVRAPAAILPMVLAVFLLFLLSIPTLSSQVRDDLYDATYIGDAAAVQALLETTSSEIISSRPPVCSTLAIINVKLFSINENC